MTKGEPPLISVVVPTFNRPDLVLRAVRSAAAQTMGDIEIIVVVDGRDDATARLLGEMADPRLRVILPARHLGNADARNAGVAEARGRWTALLDDDDMWLPVKLERQLATAERSERPRPIVSCRILARTGTEEFVWPRRRPRPEEPLSEYLFCRSVPFNGEGMVQTSTIFTATELLRRIPFRSGLKRFVDLDWLLRAAAEDAAVVEFVSADEPLSVWHIEQDRARVSRAQNWGEALRWMRENRHLVTPRAYAAFLLTIVSATAAGQKDYRAFPALAAEAVRHGRPGWAETVTHLGNFLFPEPARRRIAARFTGSG
jgi:glycosyltransferase involved in cell wall biosynthesis